jgi:hypothetical protein
MVGASLSGDPNKGWMIRSSRLDLAPMHGSDQECHLVGSSALVSASSSPSRGCLRKAAYWVYLRQDIYMAILNQRPMKVSLSSIPIPGTGSSTLNFSDCAWAKRMVAIMAHIVAFCFGDGARASVSGKSFGPWHMIGTPENLPVSSHITTVRGTWRRGGTGLTTG